MPSSNGDSEDTLVEEPSPQLGQWQQKKHCWAIKKSTAENLYSRQCFVSGR